MADEKNPTQVGGQGAGNQGKDGNKKKTDEEPLPSWANWIGWYFLLLAAIIAGLLAFVWRCFELKSEEGLLLLVIVAGAMGSYVHAATSFSTYVGNRRQRRSWVWWYMLRPFIGIALALIFYFLMRGGLFSTNADANTVDPFGIAAVAALAGMFSKQATDKLREIFDNLFKTEKGDDQRSDKLEAPQLAKDVMVPIQKMSVYTIKQGASEDQVTIRELYEKFQGIVTRLPILDPKDVALYMIHQSLLSKYLAENSLKKADDPSVPFDPKTATLREFLDYADMRDLVQGSLAFVSLTATVEDAKRIMEATKNCQDVFVTETGQKDEPVKGWLTNIEIAKSLKE